MPLARSDCGILWSIISPEGINWHLRFFEWRYSWREGSIWDNRFWLGEVKCASGPVWFLYNQYLWKESIDIFVWTLPLYLFLIYFLASFMKLTWGQFQYDFLFLFYQDDFFNNKSWFWSRIRFLFKVILETIFNLKSIILTSITPEKFLSWEG